MGSTTRAATSGPNAQKDPNGKGHHVIAYASAKNATSGCLFNQVERLAIMS
jgi:hypothetical protein